MKNTYKIIKQFPVKYSFTRNKKLSPYFLEKNMYEVLSKKISTPYGKKLYSSLLFSTQLLKIQYGIKTTAFLRKIARKSLQMRGDRSHNLIFLLNSKLDSLLFKAGYTESINSAKQLVKNYGVNVVSANDYSKKLVNIPNYITNKYDIVSVPQENPLVVSKCYTNFYSRLSLFSKWLVYNNILKKISLFDNWIVKKKPHLIKYKLIFNRTTRRPIGSKYLKNKNSFFYHIKKTIFKLSSNKTAKIRRRSLKLLKKNLHSFYKLNRGSFRFINYSKIFSEEYIHSVLRKSSSKASSVYIDLSKNITPMLLSENWNLIKVKKFKTYRKKDKSIDSFSELSINLMKSWNLFNKNTNKMEFLIEGHKNKYIDYMICKANPGNDGINTKENLINLYLYLTELKLLNEVKKKHSFFVKYLHTKNRYLKTLQLFTKLEKSSFKNLIGSTYSTNNIVMASPETLSVTCIPNKKLSNGNRTLANMVIRGLVSLKY